MPSKGRKLKNLQLSRPSRKGEDSFRVRVIEKTFDRKRETKKDDFPRSFCECDSSSSSSGCGPCEPCGSGSCSSSSSSSPPRPPRNPFPVVLTRFTTTVNIVPPPPRDGYSIPIIDIANAGALVDGMIIAFADCAGKLTFATVGKFGNGVVLLTTVYTQPGYNGKVIAGTPIYLFGFGQKSKDFLP